MESKVLLVNNHLIIANSNSNKNNNNKINEISTKRSEIAADEIYTEETKQNEKCTAGNENFRLIFVSPTAEQRPYIAIT